MLTFFSVQSNVFNSALRGSGFFMTDNRTLLYDLAFDSKSLNTVKACPQFYYVKSTDKLIRKYVPFCLDHIIFLCSAACVVTNAIN
ncbi:MAG: hypothetical protein IPM47_01305 [Sphingobacteriales bacterium]|nr:MAG: hypothetical protein IPM47_01305 [Sphingobacteriales bacterium]